MVLKDYKMIKLYEKQRPRNKTDTVLKFFRKDKKKLESDEIAEILDDLMGKDKKKDVQIMIRGRNKMRMSTLKGFENNNLIDNDNDYYNGYDKDEFTSYYYLEITLRK